MEFFVADRIDDVFKETIPGLVPEPALALQQ
jgi:hypothetical protein